ncbi:DUF2919 family protein [Rheinheimera mangrovi]|uniref:DUF2919 family protein n=1 Tax=Rheinheimera mangrovi TaxID=2498451 RepID=UPI000F8D5FBE|nr:DUF2919 family protein [Rheinheimera mangrovi]
MSDFYPLLDKYGLTRIPLRFYAVLLLVLRPYLLWILVLTMPEGGDKLLAAVYPQSSDFLIACLICAPLLLVVAALSQRKDKGSQGWFKLWRQSRWIMLAVVAIDLVHSLTHLPNYVMLKAPWLLISPALLLLSLWWLLKNPVMKQVVTEWP